MSEYAQQLNQYDEESLRRAGLDEATIAKVRSASQPKVDPAPVEIPAAQPAPTAPTTSAAPVQPQAAPTTFSIEQADFQTEDTAPAQPAVDSHQARIFSGKPFDNTTAGADIAAQKQMEEQKKAQESKQRAFEHATFSAKTYGLDDDQVNEFIETGINPNDGAVDPVEYQKQVQDQLAMFAKQKSAESEFEKRLNEYDKQLSDFAKRKADPLSAWANPDESRKTYIAWAMSLGKNFWNRNDGNHPGLVLIQQAMNNDLAAQKDQIDNEWKALERKGDFMRAKIQKEGPAEFRLADAKIKLLNSSIAQGKALAAKPRANQAVYSQMIGQLEAQRDAEIAQVQQGLASGAYRMPDDLIDKNTPKAFLNEDQLKRYAPGYDGLADSEKAAGEFREFRTQPELALQGIKRIKQMSMQGSRLKPEDRKKLASELSILMGNMREAILGPGTMQKEEFNRLKETVGDPNKLFSLPEWERGRLDIVERNLNLALQTKARNAGYKVSTTNFSSFKPSK
jgi:hypothetical protein